MTLSIITSNDSPSNYLLPMKYLNLINKESQKQLNLIEQDFFISNSKLEEIVEQFLVEFNLGLTEKVTKDNKDTFVPMIPSYVQHVPTGTEKGTYLALDLGGTNLRVCEVTLLGDHKWTMKQQKYRVADSLKLGEVEDLFDYIASSVDHFLTEIGTDTGDERPALGLGFTFSFPVLQTAIDAGTLINWTKGFECKNAIGKDIVQLLQQALDRKHIHVKVSALVNDTVGTVLARAYESGSCLCGGIFGTGTNGAYVEDLVKLTKMGEEAEEGDKGEKNGVQLNKMIVNTEWGAFDNERKVLHFTLFDNRCDRISINPRKQAFEKQISGLYLGEIVRNVIIHFIDLSLLFNGNSSKPLNSHYGFDSALISGLESALASSTPLPSIRKILTKDLSISPSHITDSDCFTIARISEIVATRAARLSACALVAILRQTKNDKPGKNQGEEKEEEKIDFGLDGSLVEFLPRFEERIRIAIRELVGEEVEKNKVVIGLAKDGSGVGAALCAQAAQKQEEVKNN